jgi:hypothetical protein
MHPASKPPEILAYEEARRLAFSSVVAERIRAAAASGVAPEILYHLAQDAEALVRLAVGNNEEAPHKADTLLSRDSDEGTRESVLDKVLDRLNKAAPSLELPGALQDMLHAFIKEPLARLRAKFASGVASAPNAPHAVVLELAQDSDPAVFEPIIRSSPVLVDADFEIIATRNPAAAQAVRDRVEANDNAFKAHQQAVIDAVQNGTLTEETILRAVAASDRRFVLAALAVRTRLPEAHCQKILSSQQPRVITALCWKAGLTATTAYQIQVRLSGIAAGKAVRPSSTGAYTLNPQQLQLLVDALY